jgi:hypothetical protein
MNSPQLRQLAESKYRYTLQAASKYEYSYKPQANTDVGYLLNSGPVVQECDATVAQ